MALETVTKRAESIANGFITWADEQGPRLGTMRNAIWSNPDLTSTARARQVGELLHVTYETFRDRSQAALNGLEDAERLAVAEAEGAQAASGLRWDYARLTFLESEYASKLSTARGAPSIAEGLHADAHGDAHRLRALRAAARPILENALTAVGTLDSNKSLALLAKFDADEKQETPPEVLALDAFRQTLADLRQAMARAGIRLESVMDSGRAVLGWPMNSELLRAASGLPRESHAQALQRGVF